jgi:hypothetical protein
MNLRDAIGKDVYIIENDQYTDTGFQNLPTEELERLKMRISLKINSLASAIKAKQIDRANGGEGATKEWYVNHRYALTINQRMLPFINSLIKQRRRSGKSMSDHFMDQARLLLPRDDFEAILKSALALGGTHE